MLRNTLFIVLGLLLGAVSCGDDGGTESGADSTSTDAATSTDATTASDGTTSTDGTTASDGTTSTDGATSTDGTTATDDTAGTDSTNGTDGTTSSTGGPNTGWLKTGQAADIMLGGIGFNQTGGSLLFNHPKGIATDGTRLVMCDGNNNRVLIWNTLPTANTPPDVVLGQPNFDANDPGNGLENMNWPVSVSLANERLIVADTYNHRLLVWDSVPTANGQPADWAYNGFAPGTNHPIDPGKDRFAWPWGVWSDGTRLVVSSTSRGTEGGIYFGGWVLIWNTFPKDANQPADILLDNNGKMGTPRTITSNGKRLMVGDHNAKDQANKMGSWVWKEFPTSDNDQPDFFLIEPNPAIWLQGTITEDDKLIAAGRTLLIWDSFPQSGDAAPDLSLNSYKIGLRAGDGSDIVHVGERLYFADYNGNRIMGFDKPPTYKDKQPDFTVGTDNAQTNTLDTNYFITNALPVTDGQRMYIASAFDMVLHGWNTVPTKTATPPDFSYDTKDGTSAMVLHNNMLLLTGFKGNVSVWTTLPTQAKEPDLTFSKKFGGQSFDEIKAAAIDDTYFYVVGKTGQMYAWDGVPLNDESPAFMFPETTKVSSVSSDGTWLVTTEKGNITVYAVADLPNDKGQAVSHPEFSKGIQMGLAAQGHLFAADRGNNRVYAWKDINKALSGDKPDVLLGASDYDDMEPNTGATGLFWPATLAFDGNRLWVGEYKFSGRLLGYLLQ